MINIDQLKNYSGFERFRIQDNISLDDFESLFKAKCDDFEIPIRMRRDQVTSGGFLSKTTEDCLVLVHPEFGADYFMFCVRIQKQGIFSIVTCEYFGQSKLTGKDNKKDAQRKKGSLLGLFSGGHKAKMEEEYNYYDTLSHIFNSIFE